MTSIVKGVFNIAGSIISGNKKQKASKQAQDAANAAIQKGIDVTNQNTALERQNLQPWEDAGKVGLNQLTTGMTDGTFTKTFTPGDLAADPGYQFMREQGQRQLDRLNNAHNGIFSGRQLAAGEEYGQGIASNYYDTARKDFNEDRDQAYNKTLGLASMGYNATTADNSVLNNQTIGLRSSYDDQGNVNAGAIRERGAISAAKWGQVMNTAGSMAADALPTALGGGGSFTTLASIFKKGG